MAAFFGVLLALASTTMAVPPTPMFAPPDGVCFASIGNIGSGSFAQRIIRDALAVFKGTCPIGLEVVTTGNIVYPGVPSSKTDPVLATNWNQVYRRIDSPPTPKWHIATGNVDYRQGKEGVERLRHLWSGVMGRWNFPSNYYSFVMRGHVAQPETAEILFVVLDTLDFTGEQQAWLERTLRENLAQYVVVVGHYPVVSDGPSGDVMRNTSLPDLLEQFRVSAYLTGHDASLQHLIYRGTHHLVSGTGGVTPVGVVNSRRGVSQFQAAQNGFVACAASYTSMVCEFRDAQNKVLHSVTIPPRVVLASEAARQAEHCYPDYLVLKETDAAYLPQLRAANPPRDEFVKVLQ